MMEEGEVSLTVSVLVLFLSLSRVVVAWWDECRFRGVGEEG